MILRNVKSEDQGELVKIYETFYAREFPLNFDTAFASILAEQGDEILGFGWLDLSVEANVILNLNSRPRDKFAALKAIISYGNQIAEGAGFTQVHAFPKDVRFANVLEKHLEFKRITSECLVRNLR